MAAADGLLLVHLFHCIPLEEGRADLRADLSHACRVVREEKSGGLVGGSNLPQSVKVLRDQHQIEDLDKDTHE